MSDLTPPTGKPLATSMRCRAPQVKVYENWNRAAASIKCKASYSGGDYVDNRWVSRYSYPEAAVYEWDGSQWVEIYRVHDGDTTLPWEDK